MSDKIALKKNGEIKSVAIFLNIIICITLFFAAYGFYNDNYSPNNGKSPLVLADMAEKYNNPEEALVVRRDNGKITSSNIILEPIDITLYKFEETTPQPMSYYTDLLEIQNTANTSMTISVGIENIRGQESIGLIKVWLFENQTNSPDTDSPIASVVITNQTASSIQLVTNYSIEPNSIRYIELAGFATIHAIDDSKITFDFAITKYE
jgi:hypothetical protein